MSHLLALSLALLLCGNCALAQAAPVAAAADQGIDAQRRAVMAEYDAARRDCATTFQVTACNDRARTKRDARLHALRQEQLAIDEQRRQQRSAERQRSLQDKAARAQAKAASTPDSGRHAAREASAASAGTPSGKQPSNAMLERSEAAAAAASASASAAADREAAKRARYQRRIDEAEAHRAEVLSRNAAQSARKPPAAALPASGTAIRGP